MRPPGFQKLFPGARFSKFVVTLRGPMIQAPENLSGVSLNYRNFQETDPTGLMETQGKAWGKDCQMICGLLDWKSEIN